MTKKNTYLILDNIRSRENVGSIFRTADAAGVSRIYLCGITPKPSQYQVSSIKPEKPSGVKPRGGHATFRGPRAFTGYQGETDKIAKTALGAEKWVPWEYHRQTWRLLKKLRNEGVGLIALEQTRDAVDVFKFKALDSKPFALILGNEVKGLSPKILKYCDEVVAIPMFGKKESLNVSVATGIALYQILKS